VTDSGSQSAGSGDETSSRKQILGPVLAGLLLDLLDLATYGPIGLWAGLLVGGLGGYLLAVSMGVPSQRRLFYAGLAGLYCMLPFTAFLPLGTLLGTLVRLREHAPPRAPAASAPGPKADRPAIEAEFRSRWEDD